ncbi:MAG: RdgB/HAM1 family non-canonical purine NTP pyrophosphatase [Ignavibacteriales bacterium]|nr:RdgB/HAM1 family non-canonical purine NTP pyrophosphatase [Ignavibacteriales bacterium]
MKELVFASSNPGKIIEVRKIFDGGDFHIISLLDLNDVPEIVEDGLTFEENAKKKATIIYEKYMLPTIADDSGLVVEQLNGAPGVISARYSYEGCTYDENNKKLLKELSMFSPPHKAKFVCCAVYIDEKKYYSALGEVKGIIINEARGKLGFGYDPIFLPDGYDKTLAELNLDEKNKISHRAKAFKKLSKLVFNL